MLRQKAENFPLLVGCRVLNLLQNRKNDINELWDKIYT